MATLRYSSCILVLSLVFRALAQQQCYFGPGPENRGPKELVPCMNTGASACCLLGDICFSGNACWNYASGNLYQYGCTDLDYEDETCPYKCGFNSTLSPWTALEYCVDDPGVNDTWVCHAPESCGCEWNSSTQMLKLEPRQCKDMGSDARVALYAPNQLAPYLSLPSSIGGSTGYFSTTVVNGTSTWISTVISGYTPSEVMQLTNYGAQPTTAILINPKARPSASTKPAAQAIATTGTTETQNTPSASASVNASANASASESPGGDPVDAGLSTAAKAGIGAGVGGGVLVAALIVVSVLLYRKRRPKTEPTPVNQHPYPIGSPMQHSPYFAQSESNYPHSRTYSAGSSPPLISPFDPTYQGQYAQIVPSLYSDPSPKPPYAQSPTELAANRAVHELHSEQPIGGDEAMGSQSEKK